MSKAKKSTAGAVSTFWQLPQNLAGYIVLKVTRARHRREYKGATVYTWTRSNGLSLGKYIFVPQKANEEYIKHEYGHTVQSRYLGWFYLLVVGLPSILWAGCCKAYRKKHNVGYYEFYTEKWADKLGGVERRKP